MIENAIQQRFLVTGEESINGTTMSYTVEPPIPYHLYGSTVVRIDSLLTGDLEADPLGDLAGQDSLQTLRGYHRISIAREEDVSQVSIEATLIHRGHFMNNETKGLIKSIVTSVVEEL